MNDQILQNLLNIKNSSNQNIQENEFNEDVSNRGYLDATDIQASSSLHNLAEFGRNSRSSIGSVLNQLMENSQFISNGLYWGNAVSLFDKKGESSPIIAGIVGFVRGFVHGGFKEGLTTSLVASVSNQLNASIGANNLIKGIEMFAAWTLEDDNAINKLYDLFTQKSNKETSIGLDSAVLPLFTMKH